MLTFHKVAEVYKNISTARDLKKFLEASGKIHIVCYLC